MSYVSSMPSMLSSVDLPEPDASHDRHQLTFVYFEIDAFQHVQRHCAGIGLVDVF